MAKLKIRNEIRFILNGEESRSPTSRRTRRCSTICGCAARCAAPRKAAPRAIAAPARCWSAGCRDGELVYESVNACIRFLGSLDGCHVVTVEHLRGADGDAASGAAGDGRFPRLAMRLLHAGLRDVALRAVDDAAPTPSTPQIEKALQGNLCRCTGYRPIVRAARAISSYGKAAKDPLAAERKAVAARLAALRRRQPRRDRRRQGSGCIVPADVDDFAALLAGRARRDASSPARPMSGCGSPRSCATSRRLIFIGGLDELQRDRRRTTASSRIGAGVTYTDAIRALAKRIPALGPLFDRLGGEQVRNMGTIGGNIANGSPIGDTPPPLIALGATLTLRKGDEAPRRCRWRISSSPTASRTGSPASSSRRCMCRCRPRARISPSTRSPSAATRTSPRRCGAFHLTLAETARSSTIRIAYRRHGGDAEARAGRRGGAARQAVDGGDGRGGACRHLPSDFTPLTDMRASAEYRALAARNLLRRFFAETHRRERAVQMSRYEAA